MCSDAVLRALLVQVALLSARSGVSLPLEEAARLTLPAGRDLGPADCGLVRRREMADSADQVLSASLAERVATEADFDTLGIRPGDVREEVCTL